jgi:stage 0 sporulation regulatory protein
MLAEIKIKREIMMKCANKYGFTNEQTIKYSQELDELINEYHKYVGQTRKANEEIKFALKNMIMVWPKAVIEL